MTHNFDSLIEQGFMVDSMGDYRVITTPQVFASGDPARVWVRGDFDNWQFDDFGFCLNAMSLSLPNPDKAAETIKSTLGKLTGGIQFDGVALGRRIPKERTHVAMREFVDLFAMLTNYQPKTASEQDLDAIMAHILVYLKRKYSNIEQNVSYNGMSGSKHKFAFQADNNLVDFANPKKQTTGSILRKIHDVQLVYDDFKFRIVLDDHDPKLFHRESKILNAVANVVPYSLMTAA